MGQKQPYQISSLNEKSNYETLTYRLESVCEIKENVFFLYPALVRLQLRIISARRSNTAKKMSISLRKSREEEQTLI